MQRQAGRTCSFKKRWWS